ncbi:hypothetical protein MPSEU_000223700 [Mayamaea pseudoterrestris]|nr:hypothetical protein MPSEU_000223700 [Mayamaea pseudoterrestris]
MEAFVRTHRVQLDALNIPEALFESLYDRLTECFCLDENDEVNQDRLLTQCRPATATDSPYGAMFVVPHVMSWDISCHKGMLIDLNKLSDLAMQTVFKALQEQVWINKASPAAATEREFTTLDRKALIDTILQPATWSRVILYRSHDGSIRAALPAPPYYPQCEIDEEAHLTGPFPFRYHVGDKVIETSLVYLSPGMDSSAAAMPTLDLVPKHSCPNDATRHVRYAALLGLQAPGKALATAKLLHAEFAHQYHLKRQAKLAADANDTNTMSSRTVVSTSEEEKAETTSAALRVYTDTNDPMELSHKKAGLDPAKYRLVDNLEDADIIFSYQSVFAVMSKVYAFLEDAPRSLYVNQFPYEGAFVQKDHLAREVLNQHGLPRPSWSIETYDLDVHLGEFIGAAVLAQGQSEEPPIWIVKPARGTQSRGHLITRSTAHILRLVDAGTQSWVVQRYIERPVCYQDRKVDCRCIVMLCDASYKPKLYMHKRVYFRIANKVHSIIVASNLYDLESVLTANHLLTKDHRSTGDPLQTLPVDIETIAELGRQYSGFDWNGAILPLIHDMIRELFNGMTRAFPGMSKGKHHSRAIYGVDVMFQVESDDSITVKLTEVTFCPANNAVCDAYEHDEELYRTYNTDVFDCMFRNEISDRIIRLQ